MRVSVVICEHTLDRYEDLREAAESVLAQTYGNVELVLVSDGNPAVCASFEDDYGDREDVLVHCLAENVGLLAARNEGARAATGDVVAFMDDDAVADPDWVRHLVGAYRAHDVRAAGGRMTPIWVDEKPPFLPEEFYWLVGVTHRGFADGPGEVRNTFGSNVSFDREAFLALEGFDPAIGGRQGDANLQGGETELCARLAERYGRGVFYVPDAEVGHKVFGYRTRPRWLLDRAFWQGYSKRAMSTFVPGSVGDESDFLRALLLRYVPGRLRDLLGSPSWPKLAQLVALVCFTAAVGFGFLYGFVKYPPWR